VKLAGIIRAGFQIELGGLGFQYNLNAGNRRCCGSWTMPRTVPKTVARLAAASDKARSNNGKILRMRTLSP